MEILKGYGVDTRILGILTRHWVHQPPPPKVGGYFREEFRSIRRITQTESVSTMILNIMMDPVAKYWLEDICDHKAVNQGLGYTVGDRVVSFYAYHTYKP